jgi:hypothetical protein
VKVSHVLSQACRTPMACTTGRQPPDAPINMRGVKKKGTL